MSSEHAMPGSPEHWLVHAKSDLALARQHTPDVLYSALCFQAQQAAEKSIKAVPLAKNIDFPYTHNLAVLTTILSDSGIIASGELDEAADLTVYAAQTRYPGMQYDLTEADYREALAIAEFVVEWAEKIIS